uniref:Uncharacterized protein n=1 Tax=Photinus pyralis TaxID=7054 RepID=A0A1Y1KXS1_PHOPY
MNSRHRSDRKPSEDRSRRRKREVSELRRVRSRSLRHRCHDSRDTHNCNCKNRNEDPKDARIRNFEAMVNQILSREQPINAGANAQPFVRMAVKGDCIPEFMPGKPNQSVAKWVNKIDQLSLVNRWDENTTIQLMQNRLSGLARKW